MAAVYRVPDETPKHLDEIKRECQALSYLSTCVPRSDLNPAARPKEVGIRTNERGKTMPKSKLTTEQIIGVLKQVEAGRGVAEVARKVGVSHLPAFLELGWGVETGAGLYSARRAGEERVASLKTSSSLSVLRHRLRSQVARGDGTGVHFGLHSDAKRGVGEGQLAISL